MEILYLLVPLSVVLVAFIGWIFWLALAAGQFDDLERPALAVLDDDDTPVQPRFDPGQNPARPNP
jgi:cbb3-type cytochrome oxidase maturation protein